MDSFKLILGGFTKIMKESFKVFLKDGKIITFIIIPTLFLYSFLFISNVFSIKPSIEDLLLKQTSLITASPGTIEFLNLVFSIIHDLKIVIILQLLFSIGYVITIFLSVSATVLVSSTIHRGKFIPTNELVSMIVRSWRRLFVTGFYTCLFDVGYTCLVLVFLPTLLFIFNRSMILNVVWYAVAVSTVVFSIYLSVVWMMSLVVSVMEESCYGIEALGKAAKLVKKGHNKIHGFAISFFSTLVIVGVMQGTRFVVTFNPSSAVCVIIGLLIVNCIGLMKIFTIVSYTILYHRCKSSHKENIELQGSVEYSKIPEFSRVIDHNLP